MNFSVKTSSSSTEPNPIIEDYDQIAPGEIILNNVVLEYPIYNRIVFDRLREGIGLIWPAIRPRAKKVLDNINLHIKPGEIVGFVGINGAGKTTLLKVISGMVRPNSGNVNVNGKVIALLAMGMGFRHNLTGRENLKFGGLMLGLNFRQINQLMDEIVEFSGLGNDIDQPYFTYSSGMKARLGFSLATSIPGEIIILDESLATGDQRFAIKCYQRLREILSSGKTIIFVSHNLGEVARLTSRVVVLDGGKVCFNGDASQGIAVYDKILLDKVVSSETSLSFHENVSIDISLQDSDGNSLNKIHIGQKVKIKLKVQSEIDLGKSFIYLRLSDQVSSQFVSYFMINRWDALKIIGTHDQNITINKGVTYIEWVIPHWISGEGSYYFDVYLGPEIDPLHTDLSKGRNWRSALKFLVTSNNPVMRGGNCLLEFPIETASVTYDNNEN
ncbi:MAG: polysaccharide ABC transporter ATP-binding protein [Nitrosopumilus sp.]